MSADLHLLTNLVTLNASNAGLTGTLDVHGITTLATLSCDNNASLTGLTVTGCAGVTTLSCSATAVTAITGIASCQSTLQSLSISSTPLLNLDLTGFASLVTFGYGDNTSLLTLILSGCTGLAGFFPFTNSSSNFDSLTTLNLNGCTGLTQSDCDDNPNIDTLILSGCTNMLTFDCSSCKLVSVNLSGLTSMTQFICETQPTLTTLTLTNCTGLTDLEGYNCSLTGVDIGDSTLLTNILLSNNKLTISDVDNILDDLVSFAQPAGYIEVDNQTPAAPPTPAKKAALEALWGVGNVITD